MTGAAIQFGTDPYDLTFGKPLGRRAAGEGFLRGYLKHADVEQVWLWNYRDEDQAGLEALLARLGSPSRPVTWLARGERPRLAEAGALHVPTPEITGEAWARRALGPAAYSLTGVTHSLAEARILDEIGGFLTAPLEPWDALVCTSEAGRRAVEGLLEGVAGYLTERLGASRIPPAQLVTIPLGVHADDFDPTPEAGRALRAELDIPADAPLALHVGRFNPETKLHPGPTGLALAEAARRLGRPVYWLLFGAGDSADQEADFRAAASAFAEGVEIRVASDISQTARNAALSAADVFVSLSDNIQETFGLTPVEAMAAGLPVVVSDWDGYRDTVRHGVDGVRVRTIAPHPGLGVDLAYAHAHRLAPYDTYAGAAALFAATDIGEAAEALTALFADPGLRRRMGEAGRTRAREVFDWRVIMPQYQALWSELARRRAAAGPQPGLDNPYRPDPFAMFAAYPTAPLAPEDMVSLAGPLAPGEAAVRLGRAGVRQFAARLPEDGEVDALVAALGAGARTVDDLLAGVPPARRPFLERGLIWMAKFGIVRLHAAHLRN